MDFIRNTRAIAKRELVAYFESPVAYVFSPLALIVLLY
jgi:hypothetical protein